MKKKENHRGLSLALVCLASGLVHEYTAVHSQLVVANEGISFGWLDKGGAGGVGILLVLLLWLVILIRKFKSPGAWMIMAGGVFNFMDRLRFGYVRDYWNLWGNLYNNANDWLIGLGVIVIIYSLWKEKSK